MTEKDIEETFVEGANIYINKLIINIIVFFIFFLI